MEISTIDHVRTVCKITKKKALHAAPVEDTLTISSEAHKKAQWLERLKQMPDIRLERIECALASDAFLNPPHVFAEVARQILNS